MPADNDSPEKITLQVNGEIHDIAIKDMGRTLLDILRHELHLYGAREGCGIGVCGACTVLVGNRPISSCLMLAVQAEGLEITTIEGLVEDGQLHPVQQAYLDRFAFQCAYCTPGFILSTVALLAEDPAPSDEQVRTYLLGNLCRCGSYGNILEAVRACRQGSAGPD